MQYRKFKQQDVKRVFDTYPKKIRQHLLVLRELIFDIAETHAEIGVIDEALKWDSPSYLTTQPKSGTTIRLSAIKGVVDKIAISVHCQTSLIAEFKVVYPDLEYDANRSIIFHASTSLPLDVIKRFIYLALTYHYRKKHGIGI